MKKVKDLEDQLAGKQPAPPPPPPPKVQPQIQTQIQTQQVEVEKLVYLQDDEKLNALQAKVNELESAN